MKLYDVSEKTFMAVADQVDDIGNIEYAWLAR
jgi:hypothetical protein